MKIFLKKFGQEKLINFEKVQKIRGEYYLPGKLGKDMNKDTIYAGEYLGREVKTGFHPSLSLLQKLNKEKVKKIVVDDKGEWLFLVGRDVFESSIKKKDKINVKDTVLVCNVLGECLGVGQYTGKKVAIKNVFDLGIFLRRERKN